MKYARGKDAWAIDDRTGHRVRLRDLRTEWNGLRVHKDEWEAKHPQLRPRSVEDAMALRGARPGDSGVNHSTVIIRRGVVASFYQGTTAEQASIVPTGVAITSAIGAESISASVNLSATNVAGTGSVGNISSGIILAGVATTLSVGNEIPVSAVLETGVAITSAVGSVTIKEDFWGSAAWGSGTWGN
jgi:hypothetical protein